MQLAVVKQELNDVRYVMLFMLYSIRYSLGNEEVFLTDSLTIFLICSRFAAHVVLSRDQLKCYF